MNVHIVTLLWTGLIFLLQLAVAARVMLRPHRQPASRMAWIAIIFALPVIGMIGYLLLGETNIGQRRAARRRQAMGEIPDVLLTPGWGAGALRADIPERYRPVFRTGRSVNGFDPVGGNHARLMQDSNAAIDSLVEDIDAAKGTVHIAFYIWLADNNGLKVAEALKRAAARGVACRAMVDGLGSRRLIASPHWRGMRAAGVSIAVALPIGNPLLRAIKGRIDLRDHRKIVVIDNWITYCGSQNCADPEFRPKAKYGPWVDVLIRFEGPIARQNQRLFADSWMASVTEDLCDLLLEPLPPVEPGFPAQVIGTGPTIRYFAMPEVFETLIYTARESLFITTPYYVPDEAMQAALCASARRGVETTVIFPARNDSREVAAASRSYYAELLAAGVRIHEYEGGLLHAKTLTFDGEMTLIGSANMDRRSFDLNYENNILFHDSALTAVLRARQEEFLARSRPVTQESVAAWSLWERLRNNALALLGPVL
ncbi:MAG: cardiolipin synthase [Steroidobacteraceae bacterium]